MVGCPAHSGDTNRPGNTRNGFGGLTLCPSLGGVFGSPFLALLCLCVLMARRLSRFSGRLPLTVPGGASGTQITFANPRSCGPIFLEYENTSDRVRAGFDRQP